MASYDEKSQKSGPTPFGQSNPAHGSLSALAELVRSGQAHSRADLVRLTGMSRSSISDRVESLISIGLLAELGLAESTGGRRAAFLTIPLAQDLNHKFKTGKLLELPEDTAKMHLPFGVLMLLGIVFTSHGLVGFI